MGHIPSNFAEAGDQVYSVSTNFSDSHFSLGST